MLLSAVAALVALQLAATDTIPAAFLRASFAPPSQGDPGEELLRLARQRRDSTRRAIQAYEAVGRERVSLGMRALGRERIFYRSEHAARIHWRRHGPGRVEVLGARQVTPLFSARVSVLDDVRSDGVGLAFDPAEDAFFSDLFGNSGAMVTDGDGWFRHPLAPGSEADYQFRAGDTTLIRLPGGSSVRLLELQVIPRRSDSRLVHGSYWLDASTHAPVRGVFRLARAFDLQLDRRFLDDDSGGGVNDIPLPARALIMPLRADLRFLTVEYGLWEGRWWLPRLIAVDAVADVGSLGTFPVRFERAYSDYRVTGDAAVLSASPADSVLAQCPRPARRSESGDTAATRNVTINVPGGVRVADPARDTTAVVEGEASSTRRLCRCTAGQCRFWDVEVPRDTARLLASEYLPPSIYGSAETLVNGEDFGALVERLRSLAPTPWAVSRPTFAWSIGSGDLVRFNRVEGLSLGARGVAGFGALSAEGTVRLGIADLEPRAELALAREGLTRRVRLAGYHRLDSVDGAQRPFGLGNSLSALLLGRDEGDYFRTTGAELVGSPPRAAAPWYRWRLFAEQQRAVGKETDFSLPHLLDSARRFRPNLAAEKADQAGASLQLGVRRGLDPAGVRWGADLFAEGATGTFRYLKPSLGVMTGVPLPGRLLGAVEVAGGTSFGDLPAQSAWYLGGVGTVRGYAPLSAGGDAFWRARAELSSESPGARWVLFGDAGWAGSREAIQLDPALLSAGAGVSFLDGLIRFDVARALRGERQWRAELYLNGSL
jgi:hypothetical protein